MSTNYRLIPKPVLYRETQGVFIFSNPKLEYCGKELRIIKELNRLYDIYPAEKNNGTLKVTHSDKETEAYKIIIHSEGIDIDADSAAGAFYAIQTLKQMLKQGRELKCLEIFDRPRFGYRGYYYDVSRGRIPKVETLKEIIDEIASYKINSFQIYIEHTFDFKEYREINVGQEPYTPSEIRELEDYCHERFIDFVPSLSCFGHLYSLLQSDKYKHLCELNNYVPKQHLWAERMQHHTIDASNPESLNLIKSLIDQYLPLFRSKYFNICCDETFDLGKGKNQGKDIGDLYIGFVNQLVNYIESKGKKVMMWGDVVLTHPDRISGISEDILFLNWDYGMHPSFEKVEALKKAGRKQILCPAVSGWKRMLEDTHIAGSNIRELALMAELNNAFGILNTDWGDYGHWCDPQCTTYGRILGAAESWNPGALSESDFDKAINILAYNDYSFKVVEALKTANKSNLPYTKDYYPYNAYYYYLNCTQGESLELSLTGMPGFLENCKTAIKMLEKVLEDESINQDKVETLLMGIRGRSLLASATILKTSEKDKWKAAFDKWQLKYITRWKAKNKKDELPILIEFFKNFQKLIV